MPLRCLFDGAPLLSFTMSEDEWTHLKASYSARALIMPCCGAQAIPKVSKLGTRFFAHKPQAGCGSAGESEEHLHAKWIIARAAASAGWAAETEVAGKSPAGEEWIADVLCTKGSAKVAFEVQLSSQTRAERDARQAGYAASGIRTCWLSRRLAGDTSHEVPDFLLDSKGDTPRVRLSHHFALALDEFIREILHGALRWFEGESAEHSLWLTAYEDCCRNCGTMLLLVDGVDLFTPHARLVLVQAREFFDPAGLAAAVEELRHATPELTPVGWVSERRIGPNHPDPDRAGVRVRQLRTRGEIEDAIRHMTRFIGGVDFEGAAQPRTDYHFLGALCQHCGAAFDDMYALNAPESQSARRVSFATRPVRLLPAARRELHGWTWHQLPGTCVELRTATGRARNPGEDDEVTSS